MKRYFLVFLMVLAATLTNAQPILFEENFNDGNASTRWNVSEVGTCNMYDFAFDYVSAGLPESPAGGGLGFKITVNIETQMLSQVLAFPIGQFFSGEYILSFNCWLNWEGSVATTEFAIFGIQHTNQETPNYTGLDLAITGDGGSGKDVRLFVEGYEEIIDPEDTSAVYINGTQNFIRPPYTNLGDYAGLQWLQVKVKVSNDIVYFYVNDELWVNYPRLTTDGNILIGYMDIFSSITPAINNFIIYDNIVVFEYVSSVNNFKQNELISLYPNPAENVLTIIVNETSTIEFINIVGQIVQKNIINGTTTLDISNLTPGMYLVKVTFGNEHIDLNRLLIR